VGIQHLSIRTKLFAGFATIIALFIVSGAVAAMSLRSAGHTADVICEEGLRIEQEFRHLQVAISELRAIDLAFILAPEAQREQLLAEMDEHHETIEHAFAGLLSHKGITPEVRRELEEAEEAVNSWSAATEATLIEDVTNGDLKVQRMPR